MTEHQPTEQNPPGSVDPSLKPLISDPQVTSPTQSSMDLQQQTNSGPTNPVAPLSTVIDVGSQLGPYQLVDKLGEGGMGAVYKAKHTKLGKLVALKILPQHLMSRSDALARFEREMLSYHGASGTLIST